MVMVSNRRLAKVSCKLEGYFFRAHHHDRWHSRRQGVVETTQQPAEQTLDQFSGARENAETAKLENDLDGKGLPNELQRESTSKNTEGWGGVGRVILFLRYSFTPESLETVL